MTDQRPNILLIQADQMAAPTLPFYGGKVVDAPHMAELAAGGVIFDQAYCNSPLCAPSRFSMMSGRLPSEIGAYDNAAEFPADQPTFAHALRLLGYRTALSGKMHFVGPDQLHGFEERLTTDIYPADFGWTPNWLETDQRQDYFHTMLSVVDAGPCRRSLQLDFDEDAGFQAVRKIYDFARGGDARPFFLTASFTHPHDPYTITQPYWDRYSDADIDLPAVPRLPDAQQDPHSQRLLFNFNIDQYDINDARIRAARHAYYGAISYIDDKVGELLAALEATGQRDNTIVIVTSDHGDMLGERGLWYKMHFYEMAARVPLLVHAPARFAPQRVSQNVSLLDLFPTLMDLAGLEPSEAGETEALTRLRDTLPGSSLLPALSGDAESLPDQVLAEYLSESALGPLLMIRRGAYKYILGEGSPAQLFAPEQDPTEMTNLAGDPDYGEFESGFADEVARTWDQETLKAKVIASQQRRLLVDKAAKRGRFAPWDFQPFVDAAQLYARNVSDSLGDQERGKRLPYLETPEPDGRG